MSSSLWTASRARAWASWNSRWRRVGRLPPARPRAIRAVVNSRRTPHPSAAGAPALSFCGASGWSGIGDSCRELGQGAAERLREIAGQGRAHRLVEDAHTLQPGFEFGRRAQAEDLPGVERVVE